MLLRKSWTVLFSLNNTSRMFSQLWPGWHSRDYCRAPTLPAPHACVWPVGQWSCWEEAAPFRSKTPRPGQLQQVHVPVLKVMDAELLFHFPTQPVHYDFVLDPFFQYLATQESHPKPCGLAPREERLMWETVSLCGAQRLLNQRRPVLWWSVYESGRLKQVLVATWTWASDFTLVSPRFVS